MITLLIIALAIIVGATIQRLSGTGIGIVTSPFLTALIGPISGVLITNLVGLLGALMMIYPLRHYIEWKKYAIITFSGFLGMIPGLWLINHLPTGWLKIIIGGFVFFSLITTLGVKNLPAFTGEKWRILAGVFSGFSSISAGMSGPALVLYSRISKWKQENFAATMQPTFATFATLSVALKLMSGVSLPENISLTAIAIISVVSIFIGTHLGDWLSAYIKPIQARNMALFLATVGAIVAIYTGLQSL